MLLLLLVMFSLLILFHYSCKYYVWSLQTLSDFVNTLCQKILRLKNNLNHYIHYLYFVFSVWDIWSVSILWVNFAFSVPYCCNKVFISKTLIVILFFVFLFPLLFLKHFSSFFYNVHSLAFLKWFLIYSIVWLCLHSFKGCINFLIKHIYYQHILNFKVFSPRTISYNGMFRACCGRITCQMWLHNFWLYSLCS